ncbi:MAG: hypothetical protein JJ956_20025, partial [Pseudomonadales bacterium]|nr:hypothetical protein [Pseudomonadales bacterium]
MTLPKPGMDSQFVCVILWGKSEEVMSEQQVPEYIAALRDMIDASQRIVVFTGAGISTESGIPDFRGPK